MNKTNSRILLILVLLSPGVGHATLLSNPVLEIPGNGLNLWRYATLPSAAIMSATDFATDIAEIDGSVFLGYVSGQVGFDTGVDAFAGDGDEGSFHVFSAVLTALLTDTITLSLGGDDGHSLFIDGKFVAGAGFGVPVDYEIGLAAGQSIAVEIVLANSLGGWSVGLGVENDAGGTNPLSADPRLVLRAPLAVDEPHALALFAVALASFFGRGVRPLRRRPMCNAT